MRSFGFALAVCCLAGTSIASAGKGDHRVDWTRGVVIARGATAGDLRAPSPAVARVAAERGARQQAQSRLLAAARKLDTAGGKTVGDMADADPDVAARLGRAAERSLDLHVDYSSDGSVVLEGGLPIDAIRAAVYGPDSPPEAGGDTPAALVVDARKLALKPLVGISITAGDEVYRGPTVYFDEARAVAKDQRFSGKREQVKATELRDGSLVISGGQTAVAAAKRAGAPVVVLVKKLK